MVMTRPSPAPIVRDYSDPELRAILLGLPWVPREDEALAQDLFENEPGYSPGLSKERMKP